MAYFSNGTEGAMYEEEYCSRCVHQGPEDGPGCTVWLAHMLHNYEECNKKDSILHLLIPRRKDGFADKCSMFHEDRPLEREEIRAQIAVAEKDGYLKGYRDGREEGRDG